MNLRYFSQKFKKWLIAAQNLILSLQFKKNAIFENKEFLMILEGCAFLMICHFKGYYHSLEGAIP